MDLLKKLFDKLDKQIINFTRKHLLCNNCEFFSSNFVITVNTQYHRKQHICPLSLQKFLNFWRFYGNYMKRERMNWLEYQLMPSMRNQMRKMNHQLLFLIDSAQMEDHRHWLKNPTSIMMNLNNCGIISAQVWPKGWQLEEVERQMWNQKDLLFIVLCVLKFALNGISWVRFLKRKDPLLGFFNMQSICLVLFYFRNL